MIAATAASVLLVIYAIANHNSKWAFFLIYSSICTFLYTVGYLLEITSPTLEAAFIGIRVQKMGSPLLVVFNYLFIRDIYEEKRLSFYGYCLLFALPIFNMFTIQAFPLVRLHYTDIEYFFNGYFANCQGFVGPMSHIANFYNFFLVSLSIYRILKHTRIESKLRKRQSIYLIISIMIPLFVNIYHILSYNYIRLDLNPFAVSISLIPLIYSVQIQNLLNVVPIARDQVIESMEDAFIVCGNDFSFLDANSAAKKLFPELNILVPGEISEQVKRFKDESQLSLQIDDEMRFYKITQTNIEQNRKNNGICIVLHDITEKENQLKELYDKATFDHLMHIYNRATFFDLAGFKLSSNEIKKHSYTMLMIDLDNFKLVNDTYGHSCGDAVLETIAVMVKGHFRKNDIAGRYGGEEIIVLLEDIPADNVFSVVEKLRTIIENTTIPYQDNEINITVSIGAAHSPAGNIHSLENMLVQADKALYKAKNSGRNRTCLYKEQ